MKQHFTKWFCSFFMFVTKTKKKKISWSLAKNKNELKCCNLIGKCGQPQDWHQEAVEDLVNILQLQIKGQGLPSSLVTNNVKYNYRYVAGISVCVFGGVGVRLGCEA